MGRVTEKERIRFHKILDELIDNKLNSGKNSRKSHWNTLKLQTLTKMNIIETAELDLAITNYSLINSVNNKAEIISECYDNIAIPLFIIDNIHDGKGFGSSDEKEN